MRARPLNPWAKSLLLLLLVVLMVVLVTGGVRAGPGDADAMGASFTPCRADLMVRIAISVEAIASNAAVGQRRI